MTLDPAQIQNLVLFALMGVDKIFLWVLVLILVRGQRAPTFPPVIVRPPDAPAQPPPVIPVVPPVDPPPDKPPVDPAKPPPVTPPVPPVAAGPVHKWVGKCSEFGGPHDTSSGDPNEGLAIIGAADIPKFQDVLLPGAHGDALFRQLNPDAHYIACRWDYKETPRAYLQSLHIPVKNPATGKTATDVRAVDWGPNAKTGRVADLSPGLMSFLGLTTDATVEVDVPLPAGGPSQPEQPAQPPITGGTVLQHNTWPTQAECPAFYGDSEAAIRAQLVTVHVPWLMNGKAQTIEIHRKCADSLTRIVSYIWEYCGKSQDKIHEFGYDIFDGSFNWRYIAGTHTPSVHSYGAAVDFDAAANPIRNPGKFKPESLIVHAFTEESWIWLGPTFDPMHFQAAKVR